VAIKLLGGACRAAFNIMVSAVDRCLGYTGGWAGRGGAGRGGAGRQSPPAQLCSPAAGRCQHAPAQATPKCQPGSGLGSQSARQPAWRPAPSDLPCPGSQAAPSSRCCLRWWTPTW
jgi:hypothetical protein